MAVFQRRRAAQRAGQMLFPEDRAVGAIQREDVAKARAGEHPVAQNADAAAEQHAAIALAFGGQVGLPQFSATGGVEGDDMRARVRHEQLAARDDRRCGQPRLGRAALDRSGPDLRGRSTQRDMAHRLGRITARLRPAFVDIGGGQRDLHIGQAGFDLDTLFIAQDRRAVADDRRLGAALLAADHAAASEQGDHGGHRYDTAYRRAFHAGHSHPLGHPSLGSAGISTASIPINPAICRARERIDCGTLASFAIAAKIGPARSVLPIFI